MKKHGMYKTRIYAIWSGMKNRCLCKGFSNYGKYGAKGITVSEDWMDFRNFYRDMGESYFDGATLDRIDNDKGYSKENCRWATYLEQSRNRSNSRLFKWRGEEKNTQYLHLQRLQA